MCNWLKALVVVATATALAGLTLLVSVAPAIVDFLIAVAAACAWCSWLERNGEGKDAARSFQ
jgi:hypothetical protein